MYLPSVLEKRTLEALRHLHAGYVRFQFTGTEAVQHVRLDGGEWFEQQETDGVDDAAWNRIGADKAFALTVKMAAEDCEISGATR